MSKDAEMTELGQEQDEVSIQVVRHDNLDTDEEIAVKVVCESNGTLLCARGSYRVLEAIFADVLHAVRKCNDDEKYFTSFRFPELDFNPRLSVNTFQDIPAAKESSFESSLTFDEKDVTKDNEEKEDHDQNEDQDNNKSRDEDREEKEEEERDDKEEEEDEKESSASQIKDTEDQSVLSSLLQDDDEKVKPEATMKEQHIDQVEEPREKNKEEGEEKDDRKANDDDRKDFDKEKSKPREDKKNYNNFNHSKYDRSVPAIISQRSKEKYHGYSPPRTRRNVDVYYGRVYKDNRNDLERPRKRERSLSPRGYPVADKRRRQRSPSPIRTTFRRDNIRSDLRQSGPITSASSSYMDKYNDLSNHYKQLYAHFCQLQNAVVYNNNGQYQYQQQGQQQQQHQQPHRPFSANTHPPTTNSTATNVDAAASAQLPTGMYNNNIHTNNNSTASYGSGYFNKHSKSYNSKFHNSRPTSYGPRAHRSDGILVNDQNERVKEKIANNNNNNHIPSKNVVSTPNTATTDSSTFTERVSITPSSVQQTDSSVKITPIVFDLGKSKQPHNDSNNNNIVKQPQVARKQHRHQQQYATHRTTAW